MTRYIALVDGEAGAYGVVFPDATGAAAMGDTVDAALRGAAVSLAEWMAYEDAEGRERPRARSVAELRNDPDVAEALAEGAAFAVVVAS